MHNRTMTNMRALFQQHGNAGEHMNGTIFLHIATVFNNNSTPIAANGSAGPHIHLFTNYNITCNSSLWMNKGRRMNNGYKALE